MKLKRPIFLISGTVLGTVGVLSYTPASPTKGSLLSLPPATQSSSTPTQPAPATSTPTTSADASTPVPTPTKTAVKRSKKSTHKSASQAGTPTKTSTHTPTATPTKTQASTGTRTIAGSTVDTPFGPVQVQITVQSGNIISAKALQTPQGGRSSWINQQAVPYLVQETLAAQSANIQGVGGATYTSEAWAQSLQAALSKI